jgi:predicted nucleotidyltransferase component of viral defense system
MNKSDPAVIRIHEDRDWFLEAVNFTAAATGFSPRLIEKDYFCTVLLQRLATVGALVFKGGTCLAKVHGEFYRLSEDLDFVIPMPCDANCTERKVQAAQAKKTVLEIEKQVPAFQVVKALTGANRSTQYVAVITYDSVLGRSKTVSRSRSVCVSRS